MTTPTNEAGHGLPELPLSMDTAPRDGTMVRLLVQFEDHATEDTDGPAWTIGACNDDNVGDDERVGWQFAGWCWSHDHFTEGKGTPVGWLPMIASDALALSRGVPADMVLVPREPTEAMLEAGWRFHGRAAYEAMVEAAPAAAGAQGEVVAWTDRERTAIADMMATQELSYASLMRQAVRLYQHNLIRRKDGETCTWSGDEQRAREFAGISQPAAADGGVRAFMAKWEWLILSRCRDEFESDLAAISWQRHGGEDAERFAWWFGQRSETSAQLIGMHIDSVNGKHPSLDEWRAAIDAARSGGGG